MVREVLDVPLVGRDCVVEIRSREVGVPAPAGEFRHLGISPVEASRLIRLHGFSGFLQEQHMAALSDPLIEDVYVDAGDERSSAFVDVFCKPGVTDAEGEMAALALRHAGIPDVRCHAGSRYRFETQVPPELRATAERALGNPLIHLFLWSEDVEQRIEPSLDEERRSSALARHISLAEWDDAGLLKISREQGLALDLVEMRAIQAYFAGIARAPTDVELQSIAVAWSEHCSHKTFKAIIHFDHDGRQETINGLLAECIAAPTRELAKPWVRSAFVDNAGVIAFDEEFDLAFKVETHNHPSALEPFGGAHTGVGGVIRDVLAVSAEPIANTDVLCFGPLDLPDSEIGAGAMHPRTAFRGVVRGVADYGNNMGIPTVGGAVLFHPEYTTNPLVHCGTLGIAPRGSHPTEPLPGDVVVLLGGRTGRDGLHGATMSSETLDRDTVAASTVQIGAPITEKVLRDVLPRLRDERLYHAINDCGAGGLCSAVSEMGEELGVEIDLALVPLKYEGLSPWEIWLSEAQERMVLAVPAEHLPRVSELCRARDLEAVALGHIRDDGMLRLRHGNQLVADMAMRLLYNDAPRRVLEARWHARPLNPSYENGPSATESDDATTALLRLLAHPNIASKEEVIRRYDHEVQGGTIVKPLVGRSGPSDAVVLRPLAESWRGAVLAQGINPLYGIQDPYAMAMLAVDEALRNLVAVGGSIDEAAVLDNFCWGEVDTPEGLGTLVRAAQGCRDAALRYGVPFISGKDSLRNTSMDAAGVHSIPGTLLISALGVVTDFRKCVTMDLKAAGSRMYLLGTTRDELGGSHLQALYGAEDGRVPQVRDDAPALMRRLTRTIGDGLVLSCHDLSEGGLGVAAAEMALAGGRGIRIELDRVPGEASTVHSMLFSESPGRFLVEVSPEHARAFEAALVGLPYAEIGRTEDEPGFVVSHSGHAVVDVSVAALDGAWRTELVGAPPPPASPPQGGRGENRLPAALHSVGGSVEKLRADVGSSFHFERETRPGLVRILVLTGPGINCDAETLEACRAAGAELAAVHLNELLSGARRFDDFGMLVLPGGFSYGDHLGAGAMLSTVLRHRFLDDLQRFVEDGRPVLGICNGFQVLARLGLLGSISLVPNSTNRFECRWVRLQAEPSPCLFLTGLDGLELPIAHGQGRVVVPEGHLAEVLPLAPLRYLDNPNGSVANIAGVCSPGGNVFGLMPHPERYLTRYHHPDRRDAPPAGLSIFQNAVQYVRSSL
jgi:phosphoribosylformylglycinamidine synthase II/phosphoribosylformylglycinamidine synthase I